MRWNVDYAARTLIVFEARMVEGMQNVIPEGISLQARDQGALAITFPWAFGVV